MAETQQDTRLPAEKRAELLAGESSVFFNIAKFEHAQRIADMFARSTMVPDHFKGNVGNCMIAINYAMRMKIDVFMAMQSMYVVHGRPGIESKLVTALLNASGIYSDPIKYKWVDGNDKQVSKHDVYSGNPEKAPDHGCIAYATDAKSGEVVEGPKVSWKIVKKEGWLDKNGSKWKTVPELMFRYRAASWFANTNCPQVKMGMMTVEEIEDIVDLKKQSNGSYASGIDEGTRHRIEDLKKKLKEDENEPDPEPEPPPEDVPDENHQPPENQAEDYGVWNRENWINLRKPGFSTYVFKHLEALKAIANKALIGDVMDKWYGMYIEPFPQLEDEQEPTTEPGLESKQAESSEATERQAYIAKLKEFDETLLFQAKASLGFPTHEGAWPPSLDGCIALWRQCQELDNQ